MYLYFQKDPYLDFLKAILYLHTDCWNDNFKTTNSNPQGLYICVTKQSHNLAWLKKFADQSSTAESQIWQSMI